MLDLALLKLSLRYIVVAEVAAADQGDFIFRFQWASLCY